MKGGDILKEVTRFDNSTVKANFDEEGFLHDTPILTRAGIFTYYNADGSMQKEFRPLEEVLKVDSLSTYKGKPIVVLHPKQNLILSTTINGKAVGSVLSEGRADGNNVIADIVVHDKNALDSGLRELSLGYRVDIDKTPGVYQGESYDVIQRNIRINHLALVPKGRAGNARLRLDADDNQILGNGEVKENMSENNMQALRLDSGSIYNVPNEVFAAIKSVESRLDAVEKEKSDIVAAKEKVEGERDALKGELGKAKTDAAEKEKINNDAFEQAVQEKINLLGIAKKASIEKTDGLTNREIKEAVIKAVRGDNLSFEGRSDDYVQGVFEMSASSLENKGIEQQRQSMSRGDGINKAEFISLNDARNDMIKRLENQVKESE